MSVEQRANIKFCFKLGKTGAETLELMRKVYGDECMSSTRVYEWFRRFKEGREGLGDDERSGRPREAVNPKTIEKVAEFIKKSRNLHCDSWRRNCTYPTHQFFAF